MVAHQSDSPVANAPAARSPRAADVRRLQRAVLMEACPNGVANRIRELEQQLQEANQARGLGLFAAGFICDFPSTMLVAPR